MTIRRAVRLLVVAAAPIAASCGDNLEPHAAAPDATAVDAPAGPTATAIPLTSPDGSFYTANIDIGSQTFALDVDTGSTTIGVAGATCSACTGISPLYTPGTGATDGMRTASTQYGDGSKWSGEVFTDVVGVGAAPHVGVGFVNITGQTSFFDGNMNFYQGIFGLGPSVLLEPGTTSYLDAIKPQVASTAMAFELCDDHGTMWLGGFDPSAAAAPMAYTPMVPVSGSNGFWAVHIADIAIGGTSLGVDANAMGAPIVDTGTTLWYMPGTVVAAIVDSINASPGKEALFGDAVLSGGTITTGTGSGSGSGAGAGSGSGSGGGGSGHHRCLTATGVTADQVDAMLPEMAMSFPDGAGSTFTLSLPATKSYLEDAGNGRFCLNVANGTNLGVSILGDRFMRSFVTTIDAPHSRIGFAPDRGCSIAARASIVREPSTEHGHPPHRP
jgi:hypothetical protein